jgi:hypothetical protein
VVITASSDPEPRGSPLTAGVDAGADPARSGPPAKGLGLESEPAVTPDAGTLTEDDIRRARAGHRSEPEPRGSDTRSPARAPSPIALGAAQVTFRTTMADRFVDKGGCVLAGSVLDAESRAPVASALVEVWMGTKSMHGETDAAGRFRFEGLVPGSHVRVWITSAPRYVQERDELTLPADRPLVEAQFRMLGRHAAGDDGAGGIGAFLGNRGGQPVITGLTAFGPSERAGVLVGDTILAIGGRNVADLGPGAVDDLLRGRIGSEVELQVQSPGGAPRRVKLRRVSR